MKCSHGKVLFVKCSMRGTDTLDNRLLVMQRGNKSNDHQLYDHNFWERWFNNEIVKWKKSTTLKCWWDSIIYDDLSFMNFLGMDFHCHQKKKENSKF